MSLYLGVDGGQSSTTAVVGNGDGKVKGWATAGPCNHVGASEGRSKFLRVIGECVNRAAHMAGAETHPARFHTACLGMSGGPEDKESLLRELIETEHLLVTHDARIALAGATSGAPGVIVIGGTGSIAFGENARGETARAGGWGHLFGDEGGAFDIVRQALRMSLREHEGWGARTALTPALLEDSGLHDPDELLHAFYTEQWPRSRVASLAVTVDRIAETGDPLALDILNQAAGQLFNLAAKVRERLWPAIEPVKLSWIGGVFESRILLSRFRTEAEKECNFSVAPPLHSPALGALAIAWKVAGLDIEHGVFPDNVHGIKH